MTQPYILPLADSKASLENVGGKGSSLSRLINAGLPVPDGFHITTGAYRQFIKYNNLSTTIQAALDSVDITKPNSLDTASQRIIESIIHSEIPPDIASEIVQAYAGSPGPGRKPEKL